MVMRGKEMGAFTDEEEQKFIETLREMHKESADNNYMNLFLISLYTGMRIREVTALKPEDIDMINEVINVHRCMTTNEYGEWVSREYAIKTAIRQVPLNKKAKEVIKAALSEYKSNDQGLLFYNFEKNSPIAQHEMCKIFKVVTKNAKLEHVNIHELRSTFIKRCFDEHISLVMVSRWVGHGDEMMTYYKCMSIIKALNEREKKSKSASKTPNECIKLHTNNIKPLEK